MSIRYRNRAKDTIRTLKVRIVGDSLERKKDLDKLLRLVRDDERERTQTREARK